MHAELSVALNFIISHLYNKLPRRRVDVFAEELEAGFRVRFQGHWYPEEPSKGSAFRCVKIADDKVDPVVDAAARSSGLDISEVKTYLPSGLTVWIDPNEVSYRVGEHGPVQILYRRLAGSTNGAVTEGNRLDDMGAHGNSWAVSGTGKVCPDQNFLAAVTTPGLALKLNPVGAAFTGNIDQSPVARGSPVWPGATGTGSSGTLQGLSPVSATSFTAATFAQTKFGSTKMKNHGNVRPSRLSPTSAALPVAAVHAADGCLIAPRLSPTGPNPGIGSGRGGWNHSPTVGIMQSPLAAATDRLSPMQPASVPPNATYSAQLAAVQGATAAIMSGVTPPFANNHGVFDGNGLQDWIVTQNQGQSQQQQQQPQQQQQQLQPQPQHLPQQLQQHLVHAAAAAASSQNNQSTGGSLSTVNVGIGSMSYQSGSSRLQRHYQSDPLTNAAVSVGHQRNGGFVGERSVYPGVSSALATSHLFPPAGAAALSDASAGRSFSAAHVDSGSSVALETMASLLGQDAVSPLAASLSQVDWSFRSPTAGMVNVGSDLSGSQVSATNDANNIGVAELQKLLLVN